MWASPRVLVFWAQLLDARAPTRLTKRLEMLLWNTCLFQRRQDRRVSRGSSETLGDISYCATSTTRHEMLVSTGRERWHGHVARLNAGRLNSMPGQGSSMTSQTSYTHRSGSRRRSREQQITYDYKQGRRPRISFGDQESHKPNPDRLLSRKSILVPDMHPDDRQPPFRAYSELLPLRNSG